MSEPSLFVQVLASQTVSCVVVQADASCSAAPHTVHVEQALLLLPVLKVLPATQLLHSRF